MEGGQDNNSTRCIGESAAGALSSEDQQGTLYNSSNRSKRMRNLLIDQLNNVLFSSLWRSTVGMALLHTTKDSAVVIHRPTMDIGYVVLAAVAAAELNWRVAATELRNKSTGSPGTESLPFVLASVCVCARCVRRSWVGARRTDESAPLMVSAPSAFLPSFLPSSLRLLGERYRLSLSLSLSLSPIQLLV